MSIVVESTAVSPFVNGTTLTIPKPTGLVEGELLVALLSSVDTTGAAGFNTASGWTLIVNSGASEAKISIQTKIATAGDVAASNFSFTSTASSSIIGNLLRCSGNDATSEAADTISTVASSLEPISNPISFAPPVSGSLIIIVGTGDDSAGAIPGITPTVANTTFTGIGGATLSGSNLAITRNFYGIHSTDDEITTYEVDYSRDLNEHVAAFAAFLPRNDVSASNNLATTNSSTFTQTGTCDVITPEQSTFVTASTSVNEQSAKNTPPSQWTNETKPSTTWTNET